jgi:hypothetical protein
MRDSALTPKFLGTGNRFSNVTRGISFEDRIITRYLAWLGRAA